MEFLNINGLAKRLACRTPAVSLGFQNPVGVLFGLVLVFLRVVDMFSSCVNLCCVFTTLAPNEQRLGVADS